MSELLDLHPQVLARQQQEQRVHQPIKINWPKAVCQTVAFLTMAGGGTYEGALKAQEKLGTLVVFPDSFKGMPAVPPEYAAIAGMFVGGSVGIGAFFALKWLFGPITENTEK